MAEKVSIKIDNPDDDPPRHPPPPPPKKLSRPNITLSIPQTNPQRGPISSQIPMTPRLAQTGQIYWGPMRYHGKPPTTPGSHVTDPHHPHFNPFMHMYHNKASDFMFKQFEGFKDFTMNTAKSGLSAGEKSAFWFYNKLRTLSKKWFTHFFLTLCLALYSVMGAFMFMALEGTHQDETPMTNLTELRREFADRIATVIYTDSSSAPNFTAIEVLLKRYETNYSDCQQQLCDVDPEVRKKKNWGFWNSMFYAGTIYTTIGSMGLLMARVVLKHIFI